MHRSFAGSPSRSEGLRCLRMTSGGINMKSGGQECPPHTSRVKDPTLAQSARKGWGTLGSAPHEQSQRPHPSAKDALGWGHPRESVEHGAETGRIKKKQAISNRAIAFTAQELLPQQMGSAAAALRPERADSWNHRRLLSSLHRQIPPPPTSRASQWLHGRHSAEEPSALSYRWRVADSPILAS